MKNLAIKAENISKQYRLGEVGTGTLSHDLNRIWYKMRGKDDPYLKIGESNDRSKKGESDYVWSLQDINFEIEQGDAVGIIGRNGAGKSTLLKILSKVTKPTTGNIKVNGRIASLLEVGTGFNPEMTGRENIYLNGSILGMRKTEISRKLDEIVDFSGVERYLDTPVKRYSSGMYVRLAFAVAANLESEILIVDEVLAVGDAEFQKKCLGKMGEVSKGDGRTVLFVSHNMGAVAQLCNKGILLNKGKIEFSGNTKSVINRYIEGDDSAESKFVSKKDTSNLFISECFLSNINNISSNSFLFNEAIFINIKIKSKNLQKAKLSITLQSRAGDYLSTFVEELNKFEIYNDQINIKFELPDSIIAPNSYALRLAIFGDRGAIFDLIEMVCPFKIHDSGGNMSQYEGNNYGYFSLNYKIK